MIEYIRGRVVRLNPAAVTLETAAGVAYQLNISLPTYSALEGRAEAVLWVYESIREDAWVLYGFIDEAERELFRQLVGVSGVGAGTARMILSAIPAAELPAVIAGGDLRRLKGVKGVGAKTAERILVDLRDKIKAGDATLIQQSPASSEAFDEALAALTMLGFTAQQSRKVLGKLFDSEPGLKVEVAIRKALPLM
ncbi:MAG: Holliday junction branch migration protein RuvA [Muribaculaceae bacterium]|nr:Holliday junction branch migration protein RuvA [Muribaculaceae bacterium]MDE5929267.1 Holliday junction branch migration protein RuvA [Muribaculaceae bacterium]MDE6130297.1 Holliday junction branch migration protein RuvA [Muribaculaceae bacterium]